MAGQRNTGGPRDAAPEAERPASPGDAGPRSAAQWSARLAALRPTLRRVIAAPTPGGPAAQGRPAYSRRELAQRWGLIALLAVVLLAGAGALGALSHAPEDTAGQLCADAQAGRYGAAYDLLDPALRAQVSRANLAHIGQALDATEGHVTSCTATSYGYALGSGRAEIDVRIVRASGQSVSGQLEMADESGWKVAALDPRLIGASLGALDAALRFCDALRASDGSGLLALTSGDASAGLGGAEQLAANLSTWQQVDGPVTGCTLAGIGNGAVANDTVAQVTLSVTRARRGTAVAALGLADESPGWRVTALGANLLGSDLGPLAVGQRFCAALASGDYAAAYALFSPSYTAQVSLDQFSAAFAPLGGTWSCTPRLSTYSVSGASGSYDVGLTLSGASGPLALTATLRFTLTNGAWAIQTVEPRGQ